MAQDALCGGHGDTLSRSPSRKDQVPQVPQTPSGSPSAAESCLPTGLPSLMGPQPKTEISEAKGPALGPNMEQH